MSMLLKQFIISDKDGNITAQELFEVHDWGWFLYSDILKERIQLYQRRYLFVIRFFNNKRGKWSCLDIIIYKQKAAAIRQFKRNEEHILMGRGYRK